MSLQMSERGQTFKPEKGLHYYNSRESFKT